MIGQATGELASLVARADEDRWLAARLAPEGVRARLIAIYALNNEIARVAETVREPQIGQMRLLWWRETVDEVAGGQPPRAHPAAQALAAAHADRPLPLATFHALIEARLRDFDVFATWEEVAAYIDATAGSVLKLALRACGDAPVSEEFIRAGGRAWGYAGLLRAAPALRAKRQAVFPDAPDAADALLAERSLSAYAEAKKAVPRAAELFPALGYLTFVPAYAAGQRPSRFARQLRLLGASLTGRI
ncbi:MAG: squalene/phytoene synthase family protein [Hyphomonadaceae bacterium]|nr:squalene/phytoene synthase family protein [Hyphomonadaceae bacterium]